MQLYTMLIVLKVWLKLPNNITQQALAHRFRKIPETIDVEWLYVDAMRPSNRKEVIQSLRDEYEFTAKQIADILGIKLETVYYHMYRKH